MLLPLILAGIAFYEVFFGLRVLSHIRGMSAAGSESLAVVRSEEMSDDDKSKAMLRMSGRVFRETGLALIKTLLAAAAAAAVLWLVSLILGPALGWSFDALLRFSVSLIGLIGVIVVLVIYGKLRSHGRD